VNESLHYLIRYTLQTLLRVKLTSKILGLTQSNRRESVLKKKGISRRNKEVHEGRIFEYSFFFTIQNSLKLVELKNCIGRGDIL
jgi:hypothetical protein